MRCWRGRSSKALCSQRWRPAQQMSAGWWLRQTSSPTVSHTAAFAPGICSLSVSMCCCVYAAARLLCGAGSKYCVVHCCKHLVRASAVPACVAGEATLHSTTCIHLASRAARPHRSSAAQHARPLSPPEPPARPRARRPRRAAGCVLRVPQRLLLHESVALADVRFGGAFRALRAEAGPGLDARAALCLLLLLERARGPASAWAPYVDVLPDTYGAQRRFLSSVSGASTVGVCSSRQAGIEAGSALRWPAPHVAALPVRVRGAERGAPRWRRAGDPTWWSAADLALVEGTRLGAAAAAHAAALRRLAAWRDRLLELHRCAHAPGYPASTLILSAGSPVRPSARDGAARHRTGGRVRARAGRRDWPGSAGLDAAAAATAVVGCMGAFGPE